MRRPATRLRAMGIVLFMSESPFASGLLGLPGAGDPGPRACEGHAEHLAVAALALVVVDVEVAPARAQGPALRQVDGQVALEVPGELRAEARHVPAAEQAHARAQPCAEAQAGHGVHPLQVLLPGLE